MGPSTPQAKQVVKEFENGSVMYDRCLKIFNALLGTVEKSVDFDA